MTNSMDKVEDIVGRLRALIITPIDEDIEFIKEADDAMEKAADLIQSQQALIEEMREALEWAVAEIEGRTRYDKENQFGNCLAKANEALSQKE